MASVVQIEIHGQRYAVRSDLDPAYISELAAYLDDKIHLAAQETQSVDLLRVIIVAALNLTDELFRTRADGQGIEGRLLARAGDIERLVDQVLADTRAQAIAANE
jgi:cell division protein ZapA